MFLSSGVLWFVFVFLWGFNMKHTISIEDFEDCKYNYRIAGSHCSKQGINKSLDRITEIDKNTMKEVIRYVVYNQRELVFATPNLIDAINFYNGCD